MHRGAGRKQLEQVTAFADRIADRGIRRIIAPEAVPAVPTVEVGQLAETIHATRRYPVHTEGVRCFEPEFANLLAASKAEFVIDVVDSPGRCRLRQTGAATVPWPGRRPAWPQGLTADEPVIETFVGTGEGRVSATSDHQPFIDAWRPIAVELDTAVRAALARHGLELDGDAYITASLTPVGELEGAPHVDDPMFEPDGGVGLVAIVGQHAGTIVANEALVHDAIRPHSQVRFSDDVLASFARGGLGHDVGRADEIVIFPQFAQLHAGPAASGISGDHGFRQLFVLRAHAVTRRRSMPR